MEEAKKYRAELVEAVAEQDDELMEKYFEEGDLSVEDLKKGLRKATIAMSVTPVLCGSSYRNKGVQFLLDAIIDYLPSPLDVDHVKGINPETGEEEERKTSDDEPFAGLAFKIAADPFVGKLAFFRAYSGVLDSGSYVYNSTKQKKERVGRLLQMHANHREEIPTIYSGDICAIVGLKDTTTGDTLCDEKYPIVLEQMEFPEPVIKVAIEPKTKAGQEKMTMALVKLAEEDPTFKTYTDTETGQTIIAGMGELHLEIIVDRLLREFKVEANVGKPQVAYRETFRKAVDAEGKYVRQSGGKGQYGHCKLRLEPLEPGSGYEFVDETVGGSIPKEYIPAIDKGIQEAAKNGFLAGYEVVDFRAVVYDGSYHEVDSSEMAFKIAGSMGFKDGLKTCQPGTSRADHEGGDRHPRRLLRRPDGQRFLPPRHDHGHGRQERRQGHRRADPAFGDVRLCDRSAFAHAGQGPVHDAVLALCRGASFDRGEDHRRARQKGRITLPF